MAVKEGDFIRLNYTGKVQETGEIFDTTSEEIAEEAGLKTENKVFGAIPIAVGVGHVLKGLDNGLVGMEVGEKKTVEVAPEDGFGLRDPKLLKLIPMREFQKQKMKPQVGMTITMEGQPGKIRSISGGRVTVDFNHEFAGKTLVYDVEVEKIIEEDLEKVYGIIELQYPNPNMKPEDHEVKIEEDKVMIYLSEMAKFDNKVTYAKFRIARDIWDNMGINRVEFVDVFEKKANTEEKEEAEE
ncbi:MAG: FKBP-type peptidyl-prolyl cis-trans isomerase [Methanobacterium sp.]|jgi:FKBP-type peptidyl-prolyl cis-trans isomerase SlyD